jgi:hypothetical protein
MSSARSVTATFVKTWTVTATKSGRGTVTSNPEGILCGADCLQAYDNGATVTLTARARRGWRFRGWSGGVCIGRSPCELVMDGDKAVHARFKRRR